MQELSNIESGSPGEGGGPASEKLSEQAKERFQEAARQSKQLMREEKRARKRDDRLARTITQFLADDQHTHMFQLIARLVARDCPSIFILALLSLIHTPSLEAVEEYIAEHHVKIDPGANGLQALQNTAHVTPQTAGELTLWATRLQLVMSIDGEKVLANLMVDESNIDGSVLQLTTFVLVEYFERIKGPIPFEKLQPLTVSILQNIIEPYLYKADEYFAEQAKLKAEGKNEDNN